MRRVVHTHPDGAGCTATVGVYTPTFRPTPGCRAGPPGRLKRGGGGAPPGAKAARMITRLWRGWAGTSASADAYEELGAEILPALRGLPAFRGATVLRRELGGEVEFVVLTRF